MADKQQLSFRKRKFLESKKTKAIKDKMTEKETKEKMDKSVERELAKLLEKTLRMEDEVNSLIMAH